MDEWADVAEVVPEVAAGVVELIRRGDIGMQVRQDGMVIFVRMDD